MADQSTEHKELQAKWKADTNVPELTLDDVAKHKTPSDSWIVIHGKVYNVTEYARDHPGGADALGEVAGTDATSAYEDVGHSEDAREIMHSFLVGVLQGTSTDEPTTEKRHIQVVRRSMLSASSKNNGKVQTRMVLAVFAASAVVVEYSVRHLNVPVSAKGAHGGSFLQGFLLAATTCAAVGLVGYRQVSKAMFGGQDFTSFPAHVHGRASTAILEDLYRSVGFLRPSEYQKLKLIEKEELAKDIYRFVFALPTTGTVLGLPIGQHVAIRGEVEDHVVTRSYTPVSNNWDLGRLELVIRCYPDGELTGGYLVNLQVGDSTEFRGPKGAMRYRKGMSKHIGMIAGGTGITPMYQLIRAICEDDTDRTEVSLIYANRSEAEILLRKQLDRFARTIPEKFKLYYVLDKPPSKWSGGTGFVTKTMIQDRIRGPEDTKMLLCGPPGMVNASKKSLTDLGFQAPGSVPKITDQIFCF